MANAFVDSDQANTGVSTSVTIPVPAGVQENDLMVVCFCNGQTDGATPQDSGDTFSLFMHETPTLGSVHMHSLLYKFASASEPSDYTFENTGSSSNQTSGIMAVFRGVDLVNAFDLAYSEPSHFIKYSNDSTPTPQPITTVTDGAMIVCTTFGQGSLTTGINVPSGMTEAEQIIASNRYTDLAYELQTSAGTYTPGSFNYVSDDGTTDPSCLTFALRPASDSEITNVVLKDITVITDASPGTQLKKRPGDRIETMEDAVFLKIALGRLLYDSFEVQDAWIIEQNLDRILADAADITDVVRITRALFEQLSDALSVTDKLAKTIIIGESSEAFVITVEEFISVTDSYDAAFLGIVVEEVADSIAVDEFIGLQKYRHRLQQGNAVDIYDGDLVKKHHRVRGDSIAVVDDVKVGRSARINSSVTFDSFALTDFTDFETGTTLSEQADIEIDIESLGITIRVSIFPIDIGVEPQ